MSAVFSGAREPGLAEVGSLGLHRGAGTFRVTAENEEGGEAHRQLVGKPDSIQVEVELVEFTGGRKALDPNAQDHFRCMFFGHNGLLFMLSNTRFSGFAGLLLAQSKTTADLL